MPVSIVQFIRTGQEYAVQKGTGEKPAFVHFDCP